MEIEGINEITLEICRILNEYEETIKGDMVLGGSKIIMGIELVKKMMREINPAVIEDTIILNLDFLIDNYKKLKDSKMQVINNYMMFGINAAYNIVLSYVRTRIDTKVRSKKVELNNKLVI